jgi:protocatechuate 3,4-dioxygenase beta subunit
MRAAPLAVAGLALALLGAGFWLLRSPGPAALPNGSTGTPGIEDSTSKAEPHRTAPSLSDVPGDVETSRSAEPVGSGEAPTTTSARPASLAEESQPPAPPATRRVVGKAYLAKRPAESVQVQSSADRVVLGTTHTFQDGSFALDIPDETQGPLALLFSGGDSYPTEMPLGQLTGDRTNLGRIKLEVGTPLAGLVLDHLGQPAKGARVTATPAKTYRVATSTTADAGGGFQLPLAPANGRLFAGAPGEATVQLSSRTLIAQLRTSADGRAHILLMAGLPFDLRVIDTAGQPIEDAWIQLIPGSFVGRLPYADVPFDQATDCPSVLNARTDPEGKVHLDELSTESYFARVSAKGYISERGFMVGPRHEPRAELTLVSAPEAFFSISGFDADSDTPVKLEGLRFGLLEAKSRRWLELRPKSGGTVRHFLPSEGTWTFEAWAPGYRLNSGLVVPTAAPGAPPQKVLLFPADLDELTVTGPEGEPLGSAALTGTLMSRARRTAAIPGAPSWPLQAEAIAPGVFRLPHPGDHAAPSWTATAPDHLRHRWDATSWPKRELRLEAAASLRVTVVDAESQPVAGARVYITRLGKGSARPWETSTLGSVFISRLEPGRVTVQARGPAGEISKRLTLDLHAGVEESAELELEL